MSLNSTPLGERVHISFFGKRNAGKSSLVNAITGQTLSVVSEEKGTTTDPVYKSMELLPLGPVVIIDTPGFDDFGKLGNLRIKKTREVMRKTDLAVLVIDIQDIISDEPGDNVSFSDIYTLIMESEKELIALFKKNEIPYIIVANKVDLLEKDASFDVLAKHNCHARFFKFGETPATETSSEPMSLQKDEANSTYTSLGNERPATTATSSEPMPLQKDEANSTGVSLGENIIYVSVENNFGIKELKRVLSEITPKEKNHPLVRDLISESDTVILVIPIDESAPKGRIILPQQQVLREILDVGALAIVTKESELEKTIKKMKYKPNLIITDSQVFDYVSSIIPEDIPLTSFSILMARYKGFLNEAIKGADAIDKIQDGDTVLITEGCTHHRQCNDIGTVKIPMLLKNHTGKDIIIKTCSGREFPEDLSRYKLVIHCGACMLNEKEVKARMKISQNSGVPFLNYGTFIATVTGILERSIRIFK